MKYPNLFSLIKAIPRWTILQIDIILCVGSLLLSYLLRLNFEWEYLYWPEFMTALAAVICVKTVFFLVTKSFSGIIKYTSVEDAKRIFMALTLSLGVFLLLNLTYQSFFSRYFIPPSILIIDYCLSMLSMAPSAS
jgi:FlaA1/EpsC-like NDP-sugar epimerase